MQENADLSEDELEEPEELEESDDLLELGGLFEDDDVDEEPEPLGVGDEAFGSSALVKLT